MSTKEIKIILTKEGQNIKIPIMNKVDHMRGKDKKKIIPVDQIKIIEIIESAIEDIIINKIITNKGKIRINM